MRLLVQRVKSAQVAVNDKITGQIAAGLLVFFGVHKADNPNATSWLVQKLMQLRIFPDETEKMNRDIQDVNGEILVVSQFTLYGNCNTGRRPDFKDAALPEPAFLLYEQFLNELTSQLQKPVQAGIFGAKMEVSLINDGPVTFILEK